MKENGFVFWRKRFGYNARLFDIIRIDHFRHLIPIENSCVFPTAREGEWIEARATLCLMYS